MTLWPRIALWPRFRRWCHLMAQWARLDPHRATTVVRPILLTTLSVECSCGRVFWVLDAQLPPPDYSP